MTFHIFSKGRKKGVKNTKGTLARFNDGGKVKVDGSFENTGDVQIDIRANLEIVGDVVNAGTFSIKDYVSEGKYKLIEKAISELDGDAKYYLQQSYQYLKQGDVKDADGWFKEFVNYIKEHPELITSSVRILLQLFLNE